MDFIPSSHLNKEKWNDLVKKFQGNYYSYSYFFDATAKNWGIYTDNNYTKGFAISYNRIFQMKILYPAFLSRTTDFFNLNEDEIIQAIEKLKNDFEIGFINIENNTTKNDFINKRYQVISKGEDKNYNTLATRMLKKAEKNNYEIVPTEYSLILPIIQRELSVKVKELNTANFTRLEKLVSNLYNEKKLVSIGIYSNQQLNGGMFFVQTEYKYFYITGAATEECKKNGGMYLCMDTAIEKALSENKVFDFGGSNMENIRRFFMSLGGKDRIYQVISWDHSTFLFKMVRKLYKTIKK